ncbi:swr1 complex component [Coniochaeta pulveracea]|uniref:DNA helicase n=1 Tax=Coniochaeta pulveracea TaxID=177199 RepID=A0A420XYK8_9PEZI|nr:swr1 complex component [Coniochaeta pulveracea]
MTAETASPAPNLTSPDASHSGIGDVDSRPQTTTRQVSKSLKSINNNHALPGCNSDACPHSVFVNSNPVTDEASDRAARSPESSPATAHHDTDGEPPSKRRRTLHDSTPHPAPRKPKVESPPWKKIEAEGPSSFTEGGRRKSGRINTVPLELQSADKRITRKALHIQKSPSKTKPASINGRSSSNYLGPASSSPSHRNSSLSTKAAAPKLHAPKPAAKGLTGENGRPSKYKRHVTPTKPAPVGSRRSTRHLRDSAREEDYQAPSAGRTTRIKLKPRPPLTIVPLVHREQANVRPKLGPTFEEYFQRAIHIPVDEGGLLTSDDGHPYTREMARGEAQMLLRVEQEAEPGGLLSEEKCSAFEPEAEEEPPRQYAHHDHLVKAMSNFRRLLLLEQQKHRQMAKKLAQACMVEWQRRNPQPKSAEDIEVEELAKAEERWRMVTRTLAGTWDNVRAEVNKRRLVEWEAEEQRRIKAALNEAVTLSEQKLQAQQTGADADELTDDMHEDDDDDDDEDMGDVSDVDSEFDEYEREDDETLGTSHVDGDENNMSSSDDEEDKHSVISDEGLTQEQLRAKYANLPEMEDTPLGWDRPEVMGAHAEPGLDEREETSDESIDMDDDLGSTEDEESIDDEEDKFDSDSAEDDYDDEGGGPSGLLGLLFGKAELKKLKEKAVEETVPPVDVKMADVADRPMRDPITVPNNLDACDVDNGDTGPNKVHSPPSSLASPAGESDVAPLVNEGGSSSRQVELSGKTNGSNPVGTNGTHSPVDSQEAFPSRSLMATEAVMDGPSAQVNGRAAITESEPTSSETDAVTNGPSVSRSQTPKTSDTKPSEAETSASAELAPNHQGKDSSRTTSPLPGTGPKTEIPFLLRGTLREYQHHGLDWLAGLYANRTNGILADEMGLGKTIQTISLLAHLACEHGVWGPHLVIVPTSVMLNWEMEFKKWCPGFKILTYYGNQEERKRKRQGWTNDDVWNVCITSYQMVLQDQQVFKRRRWHYMILDEAHNIKNFKSQRWQTLLGFNTHSRLLLTGTPLQNNLTELWSLLFFLMPPENGEGGFADLKEFHDWFHKPESQILESGREQMDDEARAIISKLHKVLRPYLLRRLKADVEKQMPAKYEHVEFCRLSKRQRELYDGFLSRSETRDTLASGNYLSIINCLMQLRKVCNHPDLFVDRPIMTSFRMQHSVPADYDVKERVIRRKLLVEDPMRHVDLSFLNMVPTGFEHLSSHLTDRIAQLSPHRILLDLREAQKARAQYASTSFDPASVKSNLVYLESAARWGRFEELQHCVYLNALRRQQRPIYGKHLVDLLTLDAGRRPFKQRPKVPHKILSWFEEDSFLLHNAVPTLQQRASSMETTVTKFACVTPAVVTRDLDRFLLGTRGVEDFEEWNLKLSAPVKYAPYMPRVPPPDPWHEARMRLSIQFPDKRLLQYDCGKLQALDKLLRRLQAGGHRALIFTQMTKVLDILELFLNIHGHKYLRLDGATKVEQRQILTDRFNHDPRILCFILSTRSGGLGINLTGADTVIFYDQDWNPAMDKQCQDRCHRIGQTRDVHIYRLVSEHTIEANILRKASQKQMLDDVVIQEGEFTTDYFNKLSVRDVVDHNGQVHVNEDDVAAIEAMDRILGGGATATSAAERNVGRVLEQAEDREDVAAARVAEKEIQQDDLDFLETTRTTPTAGSGVSSARQGTPKDDEGVGFVAPSKSGQPSAVTMEDVSSKDCPRAPANPEIARDIKWLAA